MNDFYGLEKLIEDNGGIENFRCFAEIEKNLNYRYWLFGHFHDDRSINDKAQMLFKNVIDLEFLKE